MNTKQLELVNYHFRNALIHYGRSMGFKNPIATADMDIKEFTKQFNKLEK